MTRHHALADLPGHRWCAVTIDLADDGRLSVTGFAGPLKVPSKRGDTPMLAKGESAYSRRADGALRVVTAEGTPDEIAEAWPDLAPYLGHHGRIVPDGLRQTLAGVARRLEDGTRARIVAQAREVADGT